MRRELAMITHLYAQCWNDEWILPSFFRHYHDLVERFIIYDDGSVDGTLALLRSNPKVEVRRFPRAVPDSFALSEQALSNECWKESRGKADWVIVTDLDEFLFHADGRHYLSRCAEGGVSVIPALGFQMISDERPASGVDLCDVCRLGAPWVQMMKASIFNPDAITEINFAPGRHSASPTGRICIPDRDELLLFHYKYIGFDETHARHLHLRGGLRSQDLQIGWGHKYSWSRERLREDWTAVAKEAVDTTPFREHPQPPYPIEPWWTPYRKSSS